MTLNRDPFHEANLIFDKKLNPGYGATIGRVAGKISNAEFTLQNGHFYPVTKNDG
jgi:galactose mutarotase-like enzyme